MTMTINPQWPRTLYEKRTTLAGRSADARDALPLCAARQ
jgi:hypothetical protein